MDRIEKAICKLLQPTLKENGFTLRAEWGYFVREQPYGFDGFLVVNQGTASGKHFEIKCYPEIRHDRIEIPWNTLGLVHGEDNQKQTWTLMYAKPRDVNYSSLKIVPATMEADIASVAKEIQLTFTQNALPFYNRFGDLKEIEALANKVPLADLTPYGVGGPLEHRAMRSLLLAKAVNGERYAQVKEAFIKSEKKTMFPKEKCMEMLRRVDEMAL